MTAVFVVNAAYTAGSVIAAVALGIGSVGALTVFLRTNRDSRRPARSDPDGPWSCW
jgi:hypothetical protein